jgi:hypothetical protein
MLREALRAQRIGAWPSGTAACPRRVPGRGSQGNSQEEGPESSAGPRRCVREDRTPEQGVHGTWQARL